MSIPINYQCYQCHLDKSLETALKLGDEATATAFTRDLMQMYLDAPADIPSPWLCPGTDALLRKYYGIGQDRFREEKLESNRFVLERLPQIRARAESAKDPVFAGLQLSILGNYIDFSALHGQVSLARLDEMLDHAETMELDMDCYRRLCEDLEKGKKLLYLTDNAGEIGFDRIFAEQLQIKYPHLEITFCVRGGYANNDATREDAEAMGIPFPVIDNGNNYPGTHLSLLNAETRKAMEDSDVIIAKGQANIETLYGSGYPIYYAFLVKCIRFVEMFQREKLTPMLLREGAQ